MKENKRKKQDRKTKSKRRTVVTAAALTCGSFALLRMLAKAYQPYSVYEDMPAEKNAFEGKRVVFIEDSNDEECADGVRGHLEVSGESMPVKNFYHDYVKRAIDMGLGFTGIILLSPVMAAITAAIRIDDHGPVFFEQKRAGLGKKYFRLHKFRTMKTDAPNDIPTHMLEKSNQYFTRVGRFLRAYSLDELPQVWDIFVGNMSLIGPRPALWNQDVMIAEREKYGANDIRPGLTGWAQINGRDSLDLQEKALCDGEYTAQMKKGGWRAFLFDCKCLIGTRFRLNDERDFTGRKTKSAPESTLNEEK